MCEYERLPARPPNWSNDRTFFYKYVTAETGLKILENGCLRWSTPGTLNDPYDLQFDLSVNFNAERVQQLSLNKMWAVFKGNAEARPGMGQMLRLMGTQLPEMTQSQFQDEFRDAIDEGYKNVMAALPGIQKEIREIVSNSKILCLTIDPTKPTMWAHYANNHRGIVIRFRSIPFLDSCFGLANPVRYTDDIPSLLDEEGMSEIAAGGPGVDTKSALSNLAFTKGADWSSESEWRVYAGSGRDASALYEDLPFHDLELSAVIFGMATPQENRDSLMRVIAKYPNVDVLQSGRSPGGFKMLIQEVSN